jgi:hypothetical protein
MAQINSMKHGESIKAAIANQKRASVGQIEDIIRQERQNSKQFLGLREGSLENLQKRQSPSGKSGNNNML